MPDPSTGEVDRWQALRDWLLVDGHKQGMSGRQARIVLDRMDRLEAKP